MKLALLSGAHSHTAGYLREIQESPGLELAAVWDDMESRGRKIAEDTPDAVRGNQAVIDAYLGVSHD